MAGEKLEIQEQFRDPNWGAQKLGQMSLFKKFTKQELQSLYLCGRFEVIRTHAHAVIEGEPSRGLYIILDGTVSVYKNDPETGSMARLAVLESGAYFGELSLFDAAPRSATVQAETTCQCFILEAQKFAEFLESSGENLQLRFYKTCADELVERFRKLNNDYINSQNMLWRYAFRTTD
jgi:CRP-like cAMP-binding protein